MHDDGCLGQFRYSGALRMAAMSDPPGLAIGGDVDEATYPALVEILGDLARGCGEVHVDLSAVEFCDLAGLRAIVRLAAGGRTVVLHGLAAQLQTVLGILGWDGTPGLVIDNQPSGSTSLSRPRPCSDERATPDQQRRRGRIGADSC